LRDRRDDLPELAAFFLGRFARAYGRPPQVLGESAAAVMRRYSWPGTVRELENLCERLVVVCDATRIEATDLPLDLSAVSVMVEEETAGPDVTFLEARAAFEKKYLQKALQQNNWKRRAAARQLGMGLSTLKRKMRDYGLVSSESADED
jgi:DNA-binding NtrC family response regulator